MEGQAVNVIDNVERPLKSDALCSVLTEPLFTDRLLGFSKTATAPTNALFVTTGNNITIVGDLTSRTVACTLDPMCERPEERRFRLDLHEWVPAHRGELVAAALTVVRAYLAAGEPEKGRLPNFARFEDWCRFVREPLVWLGMADPCLTRRSIEERDPVREKLTALLVAWHGAFGERDQTVAEAIAYAEAADVTEAVKKRQALCEAIAAVADDRGKINRSRLGNFIAAHAGRIEGDMRFDRAGTRQGAVLWSVSFVSFVRRSEPYAENCHGPNDGNGANNAELAETASRTSRTSTNGAGATFRPLWSWQEVPDGAVLPPGLEIKPDLLTGKKWARLPAPASPAPEDWKDDRAWLEHLRSARLVGEPVSDVVLEWARSAGCKVDLADGGLSLILPKGLCDCPAKFALCKQAKDAGIAVRQEAAP
jgi:hypothetical protein